MSEVGGTVTLTGGPEDDSFWATGNFKSKSVTLNMKNGNNWVVLGTWVNPLEDPRPTTIEGNLRVTAGSGTDSLTVTNATVTGTTTIATGAGADELHLRTDTFFGGAVAVDLGSGADILTAGLAFPHPWDPTESVPAGTVRFNTTSTVKTGAGNDTARLGVAGEPEGKVVVAAGMTLTVDGGLNLDTFAPGQAQGTVTKVGFELP